MQKFLRTLTLLAFLAVPWVAQAQNTLTVADGTTTNSNVPIYGLWSDAYLRCQTIYPAAMLEESADAFGMTGGTITSLTYYQSSAAAEAYTGTWEVKLTEVSAVSLSGWQDVSSATTVYTGTLDASVTPLVINFTTPYTYNGGNLLIEVSQIQSGNYKSASYYGVSATGASWQGYNSSAWASITGSAQNFIPKTTFTFSGGTPITCRVVSSVECTDLTATTATLTWTDANNSSAASYSVYNGDQLVASVAAGTYTYTFTGLDPNTDYTLAVAVNCSATDASAAKGVSVRTLCASEQMPFVEAFDADLSGEPCWAHASGVTAAEVFNGASLTLDAGGGAWSYQTAVSNGLPAGHYRVNIYSTSCKNWLITPNIDLTSAASAQLTFDAAFTAYSGTAAAAGYENNSSQAFMVLVSTDNGQTWLESNATKWQNEGGNYTLASLSGTEYVEQTVNLNAYIGQTIRIAFYAQSTASGGDNNIHIDNINIDVMPTCFKVTDLTVSAATNNSITLTWNDAINTGATYSVYNGDALVESGISATTYTVTGLTSNAPYTFTVVANCAADDASRPVSISTRTECDPFITLPYSNDLEGEPYYNVVSYAEAFPFCWTRFNDATTASNGYYPRLLSGSSMSHSGSVYMQFNSSTGAAYANTQMAVLPAVDVTVNPMNSNMVSFWARSNNSTARTLIVGTMSDPTDLSTFTAVETVTVPGSTYTYFRVKLTSSPANNAYVAIRMDKGSATSTAYVDDITLEVIPSCWVVENLEVTNVTNNSVSLSWDANVENTGDVTYIVMNGSEEVATGITATEYTVTGLTGNSPYTFSVLTSCGANDNAEPVSVSARTLCDPQTLPILTTFEEDDETMFCYIPVNSNSANPIAVVNAPRHGSVGVTSNMLSFSSYSNASDYNQYLISPEFSSTEPIKVRYNYVAYGMNDQVEVLYSTTDSELESFQATTGMKTSTEMATDSVYLPANTKFIAFHYYGNYQYDLYIDNISIEVAPQHTVNFAYLTTEAGVTVGSAAVDGTVYEGNIAHLVSTPATNMRTAAWYAGNLTSVEGETPLAIDEDELDVTVLTDTIFTVVYGYGQFEIKGITANENQARMGSVAGDSPYGNDMYDYATTATLTATANTGFEFTEWRNEDGSVYSTENPIAIEAYQPLTLIAHFGIASYEITAETEHGTVDGLGTYTFGTSVTLTAVPDEHYHFVKWADDDMTNATRAYRVIEPMTFHPVFEPDVYTVSVNGPAIATYTVKDADENVTDQFAYNTEATVTVSNIDEHYTFANWADADGNNLSTDLSYTFAVEGNTVLTPVFTADEMTLTIASNDIDMGTVSFVSDEYTGTTATVDYMTQVEIVATAIGEYSHFDGWYNGDNLVSSTANYLVTVSESMTLTARFSFTEYPVTVAADPVEAGIVNASNLSPAFSEMLTVNAVANPHWVFDHWTYAGQDAWLSQNTEYSEMVFEALSLVAHFVRDNHTIVANVADESYGTTAVTDENDVVATEPFTHGTMATVSFTAGYGYEFAGWSNGTSIISTENPFTFEVTEDTVLTATVNPLPFTVYVDVNPDEQSIIRGNAYISNDDASFEFPYLTEINTELTTDHVYGYLFDNWTNANGDEIELPMVLTQDTNVYANFKKDQFEVKGSVAADYRMMGRVAGTETVDYLEYVTLTANENTGYNFVKWVDADGNDIDLAATYDEPTTGLVYDIYTNVNGNSIDVLANEAHELFAVYDYELYTVSVAANDAAMGSVTINGEAVSEKVLAYSQTVTLEALPVKHYHFVDWTDGNTENPRTFILNEENAVLYTANFAIDTHTVTFTYNADQVDSISLVPTNSDIAVSATNTYDYNTELQAYIEPAHGYDFMGWSHDGATVADAADTYTFTLEQDTNLMPLFENHQFTVTVASADDAMGTVEGNATVAYQGTTTIKATANYGYDFVNWTNNQNSEVLTDAEANVQVLDDITYTAHFQVHQFTMTALVNDEAMGGVGIGLNDPNAQPVDAEATVADGTNSNQYVPVYGLYMDTYGMESQAIYPATMLSDIPAGSEINSLTFYTQTAAPAAWTGTVEVKLTETANESYSSAAFADVSGATTVYTGTLDATGSTMTITFDAPYTYNGGNLLYDLRCVTTGNYKSAKFYGVTQSNAAVYYGGSYGSPSKQNFLPKTTFGYSYVPGPTVSNFTAEATATGAYNTEANFMAQPNYGYHFVDWTNGNDEHFTGNPEIVTILRDSTLTANFAKNTYNIATAVQLNNGATGTVTIAGTTEDNIDVEYLDEVTLTANVDEPYRLLRWEDQNGTSLGNANPLTISVTRDSTITAVYDYEVYTLTANTEDIEMGGVYVDDPNNSVPPTDIFTEGFEDGVLPTGWTNDGDAAWNVGEGDNNTSTGTHDGDYNALIGHTSTGNATKLITPAIDLSGTTNTEVNFWFINRSWAGDVDAMNVYYRTAETEAWQSLASYTDAHASWTEQTIALPNPSATYQIAFEMVDGYGHGVGIDDITISGVFAGVTPSLATSSADVDFSTPVAVTATPAEHYHFVGWKDANGDTITALGNNANPTITVEGDITLTALFDGDMMPMTYQVNNAVRGTVEGPATAEFNTEVEISAVPAHGYEFTAWEDDATAAATRTVTVAGTDEENTYKAIFGFQTYPLEVAVENGTVSVTNDVADVDDQLYTDVEHFDARYFYGSELELTFTANEHYHFVESGSTTLVKTVSFLEAPENLNIVAVIDTHNVTLAVNDPALGTIEGAESGDYAYGTELTFTATPAEHQHFVNWSDDVEDAERTITVEGDITLTANFLVNSYEVIAEADAEQGTAEVAGADYGTCNITVNAADSYGDGWSGNTINFVQNGVVVDSYSMAGQGVYDTPIEDTYVATVNAHEALSIEWVAGGVYSYPDEISFTIVDAEGNELYTIADATELSTGDVLATVEKTCPNNVPTVLPNTNVTFIATANPGYEFVNWTNNGEEVSTEASFSMPIVENTTLTANFNFVGFAITVASNNDVMGAAYINDDAEQTTYVAAYDEEVVLNAVPEYGYDFVNWTLAGTEVSTENPATVQITDAVNYVANFNFHNYTLTVVSDNEERGTATGSNVYPYGTQVEISAIANDGYTFLQWNDGVTDATRTITVDGDVTYTASFRTDAEYTVTVIAEHGAVTGNAGTFVENQVATLYATAATGYGFAGWYDETNTNLISEANPFEYTVTDNVTLTARFTAENFTLTLLADATMGTVTGAGEYAYGTEVEISATANEGYYFTQWSDDVTTNPRTIVITGNMTFTAQFEAVPPTEYYIGATAINGTVEGTGTYVEGAQVTLTATANNCYQFAGWMNGSTVVSTENPYVFTATENVTLMATFEALTLSGEETQVACESYTWNNNTYTVSGDYTATLPSIAGCDSVATLHLTINTPAPVEATAQACTEYTWNYDGRTYTTSGVYNIDTLDANGCAITATLNLTINDVLTETVEASSCGSYEWNGTTYDVSGTYTYTTSAITGCDSIVTLILTVNEGVTGIDTTAVACGSFVWNNEAYTQSGDYTVNLMAANGCDSTVTLHLTINQAVDVTVYDTACDTYTWDANNVEYTSTGTYLHTFEQGTVTGCDSTVTLYLTINSSVNTTIEATATGSYEWNDTVYTESGEYTFNGQTVNGCDSIVTLILTIETQNYTVTVGVNNAAMGTVNPAGEITVAAGETFSATATANEGFRFVGWSNGATTETITIVVESDTTLTANFEAITYTINATANDETMGYVTGSGQYSYGAVVTLEAVANTGYHFVRWSDGTTNAHYEFNAVADVTITAYFEADEVEGIEDVDGANVNIYSADSKIIVKGAENLDIYVYDVNGRVVRTQAAAAETVEFTMNTTGVYLVKVGNAPAKRVVVVR